MSNATALVRRPSRGTLGLSKSSTSVRRVFWRARSSAARGGGELGRSSVWVDWLLNPGVSVSTPLETMLVLRRREGRSSLDVSVCRFSCRPLRSRGGSSSGSSLERGVHSGRLGTKANGRYSVLGQYGSARWEYHSGASGLLPPKRVSNKLEEVLACIVIDSITLDLSSAFL